MKVFSYHFFALIFLFVFDVHANEHHEEASSNQKPTSDAVYRYKKVRLRKFYAYRACMDQSNIDLENNEVAFKEFNAFEDRKKECMRKVHLLKGDYLAEKRFQEKKIKSQNPRYQNFYNCLNDVHAQSVKMSRVQDVESKGHEPVDRFIPGCLKKTDLKSLKEVLND